ncbi:hypothetical protein EDB80DRAFT_35469 [Ilyonectria destructans]|nr:hypothetical protein EDB80DRAFT_35469 [Ilyonectria destructans]
MELEESHQRPASQNSHYSSHRSHVKPGHHAHSRPPSHQRRPLRSVNENSTLLRSPGPLESMLKTTTETGDIGIFSIKATPPSVTYHHPPRPRPSFGDAGLLTRPHSRGLDDNFVHDDRKALPSYRDTASEIISLYGSSTQPSNSRSFSPSLDDGRRSYSLTTCSSRQLPSQKSSCTLQSFSSSGGLQRPRSPYPYPTRLKRPGFRPASPAMTDNGGVDYSKMVELDRVSYRTGHGSYKPTYYSSHRRPPPLSLRPDFSRSTSSLPSRASPGPYYHGPGPHRSRTPNSMIHCGPRPPRRQQDCSDQSVRSASLTSIVEMYQRPMNMSRQGPPLRSTGSFYYDYTEEFETDPQQGPDLSSPLCPIPQRAGSTSRPMVLREESHCHLEAQDDPAESHESGHEKDMAEESTHSPVLMEVEELSSPKDEHNANQSTCNSAQTIDPNQVQPTPYLSGRVKGIDNIGAMLLQTRLVNSRSAPPASLRVEVGTGSDTDLEPSPSPESTLNSSGSGLWQSSKPRAGVNDPHGQRAFRSASRRLRHTMNPACLETTPALDTFDPSTKMALDTQEHGIVLKTDPNIQEAKSKHRGELPATHALFPNHPSQTQRCVAESRGERPLGKHRRNPAAAVIKSPDTLESATINLNPVHSVAKADTPILSPNPISPAQQLKLTNSIPQLMKALPPLPQEAQQRCESPCESLLTEPEVSTGLLFTSPTKSLVHFKCEESPSFLAPKIVSDENGPESSKANCRTRSSKFKIRMKSSRSPNMERQAATGLKAISGGLNDYQRPRLKLKISRTQLGQDKPVVQHGTVIRNQALKQCSSLSDLGRRPKKNLFSSRCSLEEVCFDKKTHPGLEKGGLKAIHEGNRIEPSPKSSDQFDIPYPASPSKGGKSTIKQRRDVEDGNNQQLVHKAVSTGNRRGLRQKVSLLRLRVPGFPPPKPGKSRQDSDSSGSHGRSSSPNVGGDTPLGRHGIAGHKRGHASSLRLGKRHRRVRRWAFEAKRAVRSCVRRTLDRSSHSSGED